LAISAAPKRSRAPARAPAGPSAPPPKAQRIPGKYERLCWERQARDLALAYPNGIPDDPRQTEHPKGFWFDPERAEEVVTWIQTLCRHSKGEWAGGLIVLEDWQKNILRIVFGWVREDGTRRFRTAYEEVARKNAKSTKAAAVGNYLTVGDQEPGAEVYSSATKEKQAKIVWDAADAMVRQSPQLRQVVKQRKKNLSCARLQSKFEPLGADSETLDGLNVHGNLVDELHAHKDRSLWDVLETATGARRQPLTWAITTAGVYDPESIGWELHEHATQVLEGVIEDDTFFAIIFAADEGDDWREPATWAKANPNLGVSVKYDYMVEKCEKAKTTPSFENTFKRLHLDIWTEQVTRWIPIEMWDASDGIPGALEGRDVWGGLDLSTKLDITALTLLAKADGGFFDCFFRFWVPEELVKEREKKHRLPSYAPWVASGHLIATPGNVIDYDFIKADILKLGAKMNIKEIGYDPWNASQLAIDLQRELNPTVSPFGFMMVEMRQGMKTLSEPAKEFEKLVVDKKLRHGKHPLMRWMVGNASVRRDSNDNIVPDKQQSKAKIDGVLSTIEAVGRAILAPKAVGMGAEFL